MQQRLALLDGLPPVTVVDVPRAAGSSSMFSASSSSASMASQGRELSSPEEASCVARCALELICRGHGSAPGSLLDASEIGVVCVYRKQVREVRDAIGRLAARVFGSKPAAGMGLEEEVEDAELGLPDAAEADC